MSNDIKKGRGGRRPGAGNPGKKRVDEVKEKYTFRAQPSILEPFKARHGRGWGAELERLIMAENEQHPSD